MFFRFLTVSLLIFSSFSVQAKPFEQDSVLLSSKTLVITFIGHGSLKFEYERKQIYIDPCSMFGDYSTMHKADLILITHQHRDHFDSVAIFQIATNQTDIFLNQLSFKILKRGKILKNGDKVQWDGIIIETVPAYNLVHKRKDGRLFHPKGEGNGYVLTIDGKRIYIAGDTENTPEMKNLKDIFIAFLPMNIPYTMTPEMVANAVKSFKPQILYPYHYGNTDVNVLLKLLQSETIDIRIRQMQ